MLRYDATRSLIIVIASVSEAIHGNAGRLSISWIAESP
jgi:hypothetical protein